MSMNEMPVAAGMHWNANAYSAERAAYETRKKNVHDLSWGARSVATRVGRGEGRKDAGLRVQRCAFYEDDEGFLRLGVSWVRRCGYVVGVARATDRRRTPTAMLTPGADILSFLIILFDFHIL